MEFALTAAEEAFAEEVRRFLRAQPPERFPIDGVDAGYGSGAHSRAFPARILAARVDCGDRTHHLETVARAIGLA